MTIIADSGATKTDWVVVGKNKEPYYFHTEGMNPFHQSEEDIRKVLQRFVEEMGVVKEIPHAEFVHVFFYGAGCAGDRVTYMQRLLHDELSKPTKALLQVEVASDLMAAARALCGHEAGIACIMGTGSNSCLYDGERIIANTPPLGYILGDEGSGAALGKRFLHAMFKGLLPETLQQQFCEESGFTYASLIERVYRQPLANRFLASLVPFMAKHIDAYPALQTMIVQEFQRFFRYNLIPYGRPDLPVGFVGGVAATFRTLLADAAEAEGFHLGVVMRAPLEGLLHCHTASV